MFFKNVPNQIWKYSFEPQIWSDYGPWSIIERQMIDGRKNATRNSWILEEISALQSYFKNNISCLTVPGKCMVEDEQR